MRRVDTKSASNNQIQSIIRTLLSLESVVGVERFAICWQLLCECQDLAWPACFSPLFFLFFGGLEC